MVLQIGPENDPNLSIYRRESQAYDKNFMNKVMVIAITAYAFQGHIENGGYGVKVGQIWCEFAKVASRSVKESQRDWSEKVHYNGKLKWKAGDVFFVEATLTGSDAGTSLMPKFSFQFKFPSVFS